jgi:hypothetical protein
MQSTTALITALLLTLVCVACERDEANETKAEPVAGEGVDETNEPSEADDEPTEASDPTPPTPAAPEKEPEPLADSLEAPEKAVTSKGRFQDLMKRGLADHMPEFGILYGAAGVDQPGLRVAVAADGRGRWARGNAPFWGELENSGEFELTDEEAAELASIVTEAWTSDATYPPSSVKQTRVVILRDGDTARVFEHSAVPESLERLEDIMVRHVPDEQGDSSQ